MFPHPQHSIRADFSMYSSSCCAFWNNTVCVVLPKHVEHGAWIAWVVSVTLLPSRRSLDRLSQSSCAPHRRGSPYPRFRSPRRSMSSDHPPPASAASLQPASHMAPSQASKGGGRLFSVKPASVNLGDSPCHATSTAARAASND